MQQPLDPNNGASKITGSVTASLPHKTVVWVFSVIVFLILFQYKPLQKPIGWLGFIIILGILLQYSGTAIEQFRNLGR